MEKDLIQNTNVTPFGTFPTDWDIVQLRDVLEQRLDKVKIQPEKKYSRLGVKWYALGPFKKDEAAGEEIKSSFLFSVQPNDFIYNRLFAWKGSFGIVSEDMSTSYVSSEFPVFEVDSQRVDPYYLWRFFSQPCVWRYIENKSSGSTKVSRLRFREEEFLSLKIPLPPLPEQRVIAHVLSTVRQSIEATEQVIAAARELKRSLMKHLFTYGPVPVDQVDQVVLKETEIGEVPEDWEVKPLGEVSDISTGTTPSTNNPEFYEGTIPFIKTSEISNNKIQRAHTYISEQALEKYNLKCYEPGTIFMAMYGQGKTRGQVALLEIIATTSQNTAAIKPYHNINPSFLWLNLQSRYSWLRGEGIQGHISHLNLGFVKLFKVPVPAITTQEQIVGVINCIEEKIQVEVNRHNSLELLFQSLLEGLMTGKVRVQH